MHLSPQRCGNVCSHTQVYHHSSEERDSWTWHRAVREVPLSSDTSKETSHKAGCSCWRSALRGLPARFHGAKAAFWMAADVCCIHGVVFFYIKLKKKKSNWRDRSPIIYAVLSEHYNCMHILCSLTNSVCMFMHKHSRGNPCTREVWKMSAKL